LKKWFLLSITVGIAMGSFLACAPTNKEQAPCGFVQNVYGERISWKNAVPVPLTIHSSFPQEFYPALENAMKTWETAAGRRLFKIVATNAGGSATPRQDNLNMISLMNEWDASRPDEQARTSVYWVGYEIQEADIRLNGKDFTFYQDNPQGYRQVHMESLLLHELGHLLGLKHEDGRDSQSGQLSVMGTHLPSQTKRTSLNTTDAEAMQCEY